MVNFNSEGAFTANKAHILELVILGRRDELINTFQLWREYKIGLSSKEESMKHKLRAVMFALFLELERPIYRRLSVFDKKSKKVNSSKFDELSQVIQETGEVEDTDLVDAYLVFNKALDEMNLIKIDNKRSYDTTDVESENSEKGL